MPVGLKIVLVNLEPISDKQCNPFQPTIRKCRTPLRKNISIWQYTAGKV